jgi:hypothetical protein
LDSAKLKCLHSTAIFCLERLFITLPFLPLCLEGSSFNVYPTASIRITATRRFLLQRPSTLYITTLVLRRTARLLTAIGRRITMSLFPFFSGLTTLSFCVDPA